jgi:murein DD-endopeptidase MepM/ murein hydrolase activator NlpD
VLGPPVAGKGWVAFNGCCEPGFPHRGSVAPYNGALLNSQRFALDWKRMNEDGAFYTGDRTQNESYVDYGADVLAVADGTVVATLDTLEPNEPGILPANDPIRAPLLTVQTVDGNHIVLDLGNGTFAFYAHLQKGTLRVKPGDTVKQGEVIAKLGNTGNSNASHLHFHLMDGPSVLGSHGVPFVISSFDYAGQVPMELIEAADDYLTGTFGEHRLPTPQPRTNELPLAWAIVNFPE